MLEAILPRILQFLGIGFLVANLRLVWQFVRFRRLRHTAVIVWPGRKPPYYGLLLSMAIVLGVLVFVKIVVQQRPPTDAFGEGMMFVYYGYLLPLSLRIGRGFYEHGVWAETGFLPYSQIGGLSWREGDEPTLVIVPRMRRLAKPLVVPRANYAAVRRLLREKIGAHVIQFSTKMLDLGAHDDRDDV